MSSPRIRPPEELGALLDELDRVMDEAARLRQEVTRQLDEHRASYRASHHEGPRRPLDRPPVDRRPKGR